MMRKRSFSIVVVAIAAVSWTAANVAAAPRCSYVATYPSAIGRHTFMLATATAGRMTAPLDTFDGSGGLLVQAQVMRMDDVAGFQSELVRYGLRSSGGSAVFIRYRIGAGCGPVPAHDGAFDSVGVSGLYVGHPRPANRWIGGRPTFDILRAQHYPLPQRLRGPSGHVVITVVDSTPTMTADELFTMFRALWSESASVNDRSVERRIRHWLESNPRAARKQPAKELRCACCQRSPMRG
jgi:hypothetical protein